MRLVRILGSVKVAVSLIIGLVLILTVSTLAESKFGTPFVQKNFYTAHWFDAFLALIWINIFCATLSRIPFKRKHIGFVITHIGILTMLIGCLVTRLWGVEGQMTLFEGDIRDRILLEGYELSIKPSTGPEITARLKPRSFRGNDPFELPESPQGARFSVGAVHESASEWMRVSEGSPADPLNRAVQVKLSSEMIGLQQTFWLIEHDPHNPNSAFANLGPAEFRLQTRADEDEVSVPTLILSRPADAITESIPLNSPFTGEVELRRLNLTLLDARYLPQAKVKDGKLFNMPEATRFNPAVEFKLRDASGYVEEHTRFYLFPGFPTLKGGEARDRFHIEAELKVPLPEEFRKSDGPGLTLHVSPDNQWTYSAVSSKESQTGIPFKSGQTYATGWMDMRFEALKMHTRARVERVVEPSTSRNAAFAAEIIMQTADGRRVTQWVFPDSPAIFSNQSHRYIASLKPVDLSVPFALHLVDFRKTDYPGTNNAASFESDVILFDRIRGVTIERKIYMNHPLEYRGYKIFQASYMQDPQMGEASVFSIAKNPGIALIYPGVALILAGVITLFYLHPFFTRKK